MLPLTDETLERVRSLFPSAEESTVVQLLEHDCGANLPLSDAEAPEGVERVRYAVLKLSHGRLAELRVMVEAAKTDWRDVLVWSGFGNDVKAHLRWHP